MKSKKLKKVFLLFLVFIFSNTGEIEAEVGKYCCKYSEAVMQSVFGITEIRGFATVGPVITIPSSGTGPEGGLGASQDINVCEANCKTELLGFGLGLCHSDSSFGWYDHGTVKGVWKGTYSYCIGIPEIGKVTFFRKSFFKGFLGSMCSGCCMI